MVAPAGRVWQLNCCSHYWIRNGGVVWGESWADEEIAAGRLAEEQRRQKYYDSIGEHVGVIGRLCGWVRSWFAR